MIFRILEDRYAEKLRAAKATDKAADARFMALALTLGRRGLGRTGTNPSVGAVIVKDGVIVGRGRTQDGGRPHAEVEALRQAGDAARGATLYVTLEPCSHVGRSPPCADAVIAARLARVVSAMEDPNPQVAGQGHARLRSAGLTVEIGQGGDQAARDHAGHIRRVNDGRPHVILKFAVSSDGMIGAAGRKPVAITGEEARRRVHLLRAQCDAILVGIGTLLSDDPDLTCRLPGMASQSPVRVVLDASLRTPTDSRLVHTSRQTPLWLMASEIAEAASAARLGAAGAEIVRMPPRAGGGIDLAQALRVLGERGITRLMVEGGSRVAAELIAHDLADEIWLLSGAAAIGSDGVPALDAKPLGAITASPNYRKRASETLGPDTLTIYERA
jgi:diaminohydroxyphosphoribosylaminopyrimidine deaminase/5-amino-6-(5-phosphoribosylamino)uracil reductase